MATDTFGRVLVVERRAAGAGGGTSIDKAAVRFKARVARKAHQERMAALRAEAQRIVATGKCPECGTALVRNLALAGWWQCGAYGTPSFRKPEHRTLASCMFQTFTE